MERLGRQGDEGINKVTFQEESVNLARARTNSATEEGRDMQDQG